MIDARIAVCFALSIGTHLVLGEGLDALPARTHATRPPKIEVRVVEPPPPDPIPEPPPPPPPPPPPTPAPPKIVDKPRITRTQPAPATEQPPTPPTTATTTSTEPTAKPVFGVTMESTSRSGTTTAPVGNTTSPSAPTGPPPKTGPPPPAPAHEVTKMPLPRGRCAGTYTDAAREAGVEGVVVLDLVVDAEGRAQNITVVERLPHGLTEAAIAALQACRFDPGERAGVAVAVRVRGFKIRFLLDAN